MPPGGHKMGDVPGPDEALRLRTELRRARRALEQARQELEQTRTEREQSLAQMRAANERLLIASVHADELAERADAARRHAESLAMRLAASEAAARLSEDQFRTIANTVPMLAWSATPEGHIAWFNARWSEYTGTALDDQVGGTWESVHDPEDFPRVLAGWRAALASGEPWEDTVRLRRHDGELRWFLGRALPLRDEEGRIVRWFGVNMDIDAQKRAEGRASAAARAKDDFLAVLSHELRNPLAPILTALDLMRMTGAGAFPREVMIIERQVKHMVRLVDDLLDVSRIARGKIELAMEPVELSDVVTRALEMVSPLIEAKAHHLSVHMPAAGLVVKGDPIRLSQVVTNLLMNAAKYTPQNGSIDVTAERAGSRVSLCIRDSGVGMSAEILPRIFDLFAQERQTLDRAAGGLGLGLAIVRSLVELHGGTVTARSEGPGEGSELTVELPLHASEAQPERAAHQDVVTAEADQASRNILVVDDNGDAAELLADVLRSHGYTVRVALDGPAALAIVDDFVPDVAMLDIGLPVMDGYELAQRLHARLAPRKLSLIAITGYGRDDDRRRAREAGFDLHLVKPVDFAHIQDAIGMVQGKGDATPR